MSDLEKIVHLLHSGQRDTIEMALLLSESQGLPIDWEPFKDIFEWLKSLNVVQTWEDYPDLLVQLFEIEVLNLSYSRISKLPDSIGCLVNIHSLLLNGNQLTSLPESLGELQNMRCLMISSNQLTDLPLSLARLSDLVYLDMSTEQADAAAYGTSSVVQFGTPFSEQQPASPIALYYSTVE